MRYHSLLALLLAMGVSCASTDAATISYGTPYNIEHNGHSNILPKFVSSTNGGVSIGPNDLYVVHTARRFGAVTANPIVINGVQFTNSGGATDFWGTTGIDPDIDTLLSGHTVVASGVSGGGVTLTDLIPGRTYQLQVIVGHDSRTGGINERQYEVSFGDSNYSPGTPPILTRGAYGNDTNTAAKIGDGTVVGTFVAGSTSQVFSLRSNQQDGNLTDDPDPAISGYILIEHVPGPTITLINENFSTSGLTGTPGVVWSDNDPSPSAFEQYGPGGAGARDMDTTYDHDNDPLTSAVSIPGAVEVNHDAGSVTLTASFILSDLVDVSELGILSFYAGLRDGVGGGTPATVQILNLTDSRTILAATNIDIAANDNLWNYNQFFIDFLASDRGDTIVVNFFGGGNTGGNGLQLADVNFIAAMVPEPAGITLGLIAAAGLVMLLRRRRMAD